MPSQDGGGLHHSQTFPPAIPEAGEQNPEDTVSGPKLGPRPLMYQARELMTQGHILGDEICTILENGGDKRDDQREVEGHLPNDGRSPNERRSQRFHRRMK